MQRRGGTFSGAAQRFHDRRELITEEANAIGTAYLRLDVLQKDDARVIRDLFRRYTGVRAVVYRNMRDKAATKARLGEASFLQQEIWKQSIAGCSRPGAHPQSAMLLLPALNAVFDITTTRETATRNHPPSVIFFLLAGLSLISSFLLGYSVSQNSEKMLLHTILFSLVLSLAFIPYPMCPKKTCAPG